MTERKYKSRPWQHTPTDLKTAPAGAAAGVWTERDTAGSNAAGSDDLQNPLQCAKLQLLHSHRVDTLQGQQGLNLEKYELLESTSSIPSFTRKWSAGQFCCRVQFYVCYREMVIPTFRLLGLVSLIKIINYRCVCGRGWQDNCPP